MPPWNGEERRANPCRGEECARKCPLTEDGYCPDHRMMTSVWRWALGILTTVAIAGTGAVWQEARSISATISGMGRDLAVIAQRVEGHTTRLDRLEAWQLQQYRAGKP